MWHPTPLLIRFADGLCAIDEVLEAYEVMGNYSYFVKFAAEDNQDAQRIIQKIGAIDQVVHVDSFLVLRELKYSGGRVSKTIIDKPDRKPRRTEYSHDSNHSKRFFFWRIGDLAGGHDIMDNRYFDSHSNWPGIATVWRKKWTPMAASFLVCYLGHWCCGSVFGITIHFYSESKRLSKKCPYCVWSIDQFVRLPAWS